jgi:hypothetical protein
VNGRAFDLASAAAVWLFALIVLLLYESVLGLAWRRFVNWRGRTDWVFYVAPAGITGLLFGLGLAAFFDLWARDDGGPPAGLAGFAVLSALCAASGALTGLAAWLVLRPDQANPGKSAP